YHRPRPLDLSQGGLNNKVKRKGLSFLCEESWLKTVFLVDEVTLEQIPSGMFPNAYFTWIPDPCTPRTLYSKDQARARLNIPDNRIVFLNYGVGARRKGLYLAIKALKDLPENKFFLLTAGDLNKDRSVLPGLNDLYEKGSAKTMNYYVSPEEEALCFSAADMVLLPYISHFGSANVLSQAAASKRPVIASDYHLLGARVRKYNLGLTFENKSAPSLKEELERVLTWDASTFERFIPALETYAKKFSRESFREHLLRSFPG
ncbi:MAG TPA: hypothetical protein DIU37_02850, partial [Opitutae bacterium]|nr:hypothetical protein [Opitutae bacterium]